MFSKEIIKDSNFKEKFRNWYFDRHIPKTLSKKFIQIDDNKQEALRESLIKNVCTSSPSSTNDEIAKLTLDLEGRLRSHRTQIIPWLNSIRPLNGLKILEIGCGNGTSTVALAEQGAIVTAIDIEEGLLEDAKARCQTYGVEAIFYLMNATQVSTYLSEEHYDMILFYAVLEHMTYEERLIAIRQTFNMLIPGGLWCIIGTPNRLHFFDSHTSILPFFYWLPEELAIKYAQRSPRHEFGNSFMGIDEPSSEKKIEFARWGRGMSFHELEIAFGPLYQLTVVSSLLDFLQKQHFFYRLIRRVSISGRYTTLISKLYPNKNKGLFYPFLDIILQK